MLTRSISSAYGKVISSLVFSSALLYSPNAPANEAPKIDLERAAAIYGPIGGGNLGQIQEFLIKANPSDGPVDLVINSPGGSVNSGFEFIAVMEAVKAKGLRIRCYVSGMAASMAFGILVHCSERYSLMNSFLLWHRARVMVGGFLGTPMTAVDGYNLFRQLNILDGNILNDVLKAMPGASSKEIAWHFERETLHTGLELHEFCPQFITPYEAIDGLLDAFLSKQVIHSGSPGDLRNITSPGKIFYMLPNGVLN